MLYLGIDVGGTAIKGVAIDESGRLFAEGKVATVRGEEIVDGIVTLCNRLMKGLDGIVGIGIGCAGVIDGENGKVVLASNLYLKDFPLAERVSKKLNLPVKMTNDANAAALGEASFGAGKDYKNSVLITLGTGVGGGIVIDSKLFEGNKSAGAEIGHMVIEQGGELCGCGRRGCFEAYCSATALKKRTKIAMEQELSSAMWKTYISEMVSSKTPFEYADSDETAKKVVNKYIEYLACGLVNIANVFRPEVIMLGGGVANEGERLTVPLQAIVDKETFASSYAPVKITVATLGGSAGAYGAAALCFPAK